MRILHTSDWHLGRMLENINRLDEQREFIDELCEITEREKIDLVLIAGDIFDTYNPSSAAEELFYSAVERLSGKGQRAVVVIAGNHDSPERLCAASSLASRNGIILLGYPASDANIYKKRCENINVVESGPGWMEIEVKGCKERAVILTLPYPSEARLEQLLSIENREEELQQAYSDKIGSIFLELGQKFRDDTINLIVSHIFMKGGKESESERTLQVGGALTVSSSNIPANTHFVALGHLHRPQRIKGAPCPVYYSGSPLAYSFSEAGYCKAVYVVEAIPGEEAEINEIILNCGRPLKKWSAKNGIEEALKWCEEGRDQDAWIDLEIYTDRILTMEEQKYLRELNPGIINIRPVIKNEEEDILEYENRESKKIDELFMDYYKFKTGIEISDEIMGVFLEILNTDEEKKDGEDIATEVS